MKKIMTCFLLISLLIGCSGAKRGIKRSTQKVFDSTLYDHQFTGFLIVDAQTKDTLFDFNKKKYFTPASNAKIFTLFTALKLLPDRIPALKYVHQGDTLFIEGTGDPTLLHSYFKSNKTLDFLKKYTTIALHLTNFQGEKFAPGWAWEDYQYYFQPEMGSFPMYGNVATLYNSKKRNTTPSYFTDSIVPLNFHKNRDLHRNRFYFSPSRKDTVEIPFKTNNQLTSVLLADALQKKVHLVKQMPLGEKTVLYGIPVDSVYRRMMHESDNFLAEQLLLLSASTLSDTLRISLAQEHILANELSDLKQPPRWVDGSGLSRYNLFTPESIVQVLSKLHSEIPKERLFNFFPAGGVAGTLEAWYAGKPEPYIYAKSGTIGNVYCLSGYLITKSDKTLIFSFMNNHFRQPSTQLKKQMELIFEEIRDSY